MKKGLSQTTIEPELEELWRDGLSPKEWGLVRENLIELSNVRPRSSLQSELREIPFAESPKFSLFQISFPRTASRVAVGAAFVALMFFLNRINSEDSLYVQTISPQAKVFGEEFDELGTQFALVMDTDEEIGDEDIFEHDFQNVERFLWNTSDVA